MNFLPSEVYRSGDPALSVPNPASVVDFAHLSAVDSAHHSFPATIHDRHGHLVNVTRSIDSCTLYRFSEMCVSVSHLAVLMNAQ